jgi:dihydrofolate synthase/folylpolyglutamate synthase
MRRALPKLSLPGRCQTLGRYLLDVSHNAEAAAVLEAEIVRRYPGQRVHLVLGMLSDKPVADYGRVLAGRVSSTCFATLPPPRGLEARQLAERAAPAGLVGSLHPDVSSALAEATARARAETPIVVCGSFLTVAAALQVLQ